RARSAARAPAPAPGAAGRRAEPDGAAARMSLPYALPARRRALRARGAGLAGGASRPLGRLPSRRRGFSVMRVAVIADDLTGALDTAAPFAACGASVAVATAPQHLPEVLRRGDEVVVVNTRSRHLPDEAAARVVRDCAEALAGHRPTIA